MIKELSKYKKLIVAIIGIAGILYGPGFAEVVIQGTEVSKELVGLVTLFGVFKARNG